MLQLHESSACHDLTLRQKLLLSAHHQARAMCCLLIAHQLPSWMIWILDLGLQRRPKRLAYISLQICFCFFSVRAFSMGRLEPVADLGVAAIVEHIRSRNGNIIQQVCKVRPGTAGLIDLRRPPDPVWSLLVVCLPQLRERRHPAPATNTSGQLRLNQPGRHMHQTLCKVSPAHGLLFQYASAVLSGKLLAVSGTGMTVGMQDAEYQISTACRST